MERWEEGRNLLTALSPQLDLLLNVRAWMRACVRWKCNFAIHPDKHTPANSAKTQAHTVLGDQLNPLSLFLYMKGTAVLFHINEGNSIMLSCTLTALSHSISLTVFISFLIPFLSFLFFIFRPFSRHPPPHRSGPVDTLAAAPPHFKAKKLQPGSEERADWTRRVSVGAHFSTTNIVVKLLLNLRPRSVRSFKSHWSSRKRLQLSLLCLCLPFPRLYSSPSLFKRK